MKYMDTLINKAPVSRGNSSWCSYHSLFQMNIYRVCKKKILEKKICIIAASQAPVVVGGGGCRMHSQPSTK